MPQETPRCRQLHHWTGLISWRNCIKGSDQLATSVDIRDPRYRFSLSTKFASPAFYHLLEEGSPSWPTCNSLTSSSSVIIDFPLSWISSTFGSSFSITNFLLPFLHHPTLFCASYLNLLILLSFITKYISPFIIRLFCLVYCVPRPSCHRNNFN